MASAYFKLKLLKKKRIFARKKELNKSDLDVENKTMVVCIRKCRICLEEGNIPIYGNDSLNEEYIRQFGDIEISDSDDFPKYLCNTCCTLLQNAILFRKKAKFSDSVLRRNMNSEQTDDSVLHRNMNSEETDDSGLTEETEDGYIDDTADTDKDTTESPKHYICQPCNINFVSWLEYVDHRNSKQHKNVRIQCPICFGLLTSQLYKRHLARHQSVSHLVCEICGKLYRKDNLIRHLQLHSYNLPYQCQLCPYRGRFEESLKLHMRTHNGEKPFSCEKCQLRFLTRSNLNRHLLTHKKERPFKCIECGRGFYVKRDLDAHFKIDHAGIKEFGCKLCGNKYGTRKALMRHELRVHKRDKLAKGRMPLYLQAEYRAALG